MDLHLPKMNAIEALQTLRGDTETRSLPVIAVTIAAMPEDRKKILASGFDGTNNADHVAAFLDAIDSAVTNAAGRQLGLTFERALLHLVGAPRTARTRTELGHRRPYKILGSLAPQAV